MASLFVIRGRDQGRFFKLAVGEPIRMGRDADNTIQLLDSEVSRHHCELQVNRDGRFELSDLGSSNGTFVNATRVEHQLLRSGDRVQVGQTLMIFTGAGSTGSTHTVGGVEILPPHALPDPSRIVSSVRRRDAAAPPRQASDEEAISADRSLAVMYQTALAVGRTMDIPELLDRILQLVFDWVEADRGCIMLRDPQSGQLRAAARCDRREGSASDRITISHTILDYVMQHQEGVRTSDARDDERFDSAQSIVQMGIREALCVPLQGRYETVGAMYVDTYTPPGNLLAGAAASGRFTDQQLHLMTAIGYQAALAIEDTFHYGALVQSERLAAIGQTIATLSHHIKNILQGIGGGGYLIEAGLDRGDTEAIRRGWRIVEKNQERISNLVLDMLSFSKERQPELVPGDLNAMASDVVELMQSRAADAQCALQLVADPQLPPALFDPDALHRALLNLVTNALDAVAETPEPKVEVHTGHAPAVGWWIDVRDNGSGVRPEDRDRIFSLFESRKGARGTGLGLPVSQKIVQEHGGRITLESAPEQGTVFRIHLPEQRRSGEENWRSEIGEWESEIGDRGTELGDGESEIGDRRSERGG